MPDGSSSAAPVINPGPRFEKNLRKRPCRTNARLAALAPGEFWLNAGAAVLLRRGTNLLRRILPDSPCLAKTDKRVRRCPGLWQRECHAHSRFPDARFVCADKPGWSARGLVWSFHARSGDLLFRGARRRCDGHGPLRPAAPRRSVVIRA